MTDLPTACPGCGLNINGHVSLNTPNSVIRYCPACGEQVVPYERPAGQRLSFECPNCAAGHAFRVQRQALADRSHPWADYEVETTTCDECGEQVTLQLRGVVDD
jgi:predicted RNA-binding Zn-ribbon protein involved in translation (DUF1610 family)